MIQREEKEKGGYSALLTDGRRRLGPAPHPPPRSPPRLGPVPLAPVAQRPEVDALFEIEDAAANEAKRCSTALSISLEDFHDSKTRMRFCCITYKMK